MTGCHHPLACQNLINSLDFQANQTTHWKQNDSPCACTTSSPGACPMFFTVTSTHAAAWHPSLICWGSENLSLKQISPRANDVQYGNVSLKKNPYIYILHPPTVKVSLITWGIWINVVPPLFIITEGPSHHGGTYAEQLKACKRQSVPKGKSSLYRSIPHKAANDSVLQHLKV